MRYLIVFVAIILLGIAAILFFENGANPSDDLFSTPYTYDNGSQYIDTVSRAIPTPSPTAMATNGRLYYYTIIGTPNGGATIAVDFLEPGGYPVINLALDLNSDGKYAAYETENGIQEEWVIQNLPAYVLSGSSNHYDFTVIDKRVYGKREVFGHGTFSAAPVSEAWLQNPGATAKRLRLTTSAFEYGELVGVGIPGGGPDIYRGGASSGTFTSQNDSAAELRTPNDADIDLGFIINDHLQAPLESAPTAIANNLEGLTAAMDSARPIPDTKTLISQLKSDLLFGDDQRGGVLERNYIGGKNVFMRRYDLPIVTRSIENPKPDDISDALLAGAVIEMDLLFVDDSTGDKIPAASHLVTLTGISRNGESVVLRGRDPATPNGLESWRFFPGAGTSSSSELFYPKWRRGPTIVDRIYVQEWVSVDEAVAAGVLSPGTQARQYPIEMLRIATDYYPKYQFTVESPQENGCDSSYYSKNSDAIGLDTKERRDLSRIVVDRISECGFGKVGEVPEETIILDWYQQQVLAGALRKQ